MPSNWRDEENLKLQNSRILYFQNVHNLKSSNFQKIENSNLMLVTFEICWMQMRGKLKKAENLKCLKWIKKLNLKHSKLRPLNFLKV